ncbi:hypothetical protein [Leclercia sp. W17]|nr:hypothetical protein [Leclercia sp. W17]
MAAAPYPAYVDEQARASAAPPGSRTTRQSVGPRKRSAAGRQAAPPASP